MKASRNGKKWVYSDHLISPILLENKNYVCFHFWRMVLISGFNVLRYLHVIAISFNSHFKLFILKSFFECFNLCDCLNFHPIIKSLTTNRWLLKRLITIYVVELVDQRCRLHGGSALIGSINYHNSSCLVLWLCFTFLPFM